MGSKSPASNETNDETKETCWDIDKRGSVGETILHIGMLMNNWELVKRLLKHFPKLINDTYLGDDYFGILLEFGYLLEKRKKYFNLIKRREPITHRDCS